MVARAAVGLLFLLSVLLAAQSASPGATSAAGSAGSWRAEIDLPDARSAAQPEKLLAALRGTLSDRTVAGAVEPGAAGASTATLVLEGHGGTDQLRRALLVDLAPEVSLLGGPVSLTVSAGVASGNLVELLLESEPGTGARWEADSAALQLVDEQGETTRQRSDRLGGSASQTVRFRATADGTAVLRLLYRRPWELSTQPTRRLSVELPSLPPVVDLTDPGDEPAPPAPHPAPPSGAPEAGAADAGLPAAFDWRSVASLPAVRDQRYCGSCWAFAVVGVMESALAIYKGAPPDLSEQFLVSCNTYGFDCTLGGNFQAHDFDWEVLGRKQSAAGAVLETSLPYTATDSPCLAGLDHPRRLYDWSYVDGWGVPNVDAIKSAIHSYGPVGASVCVGPAFQAYRSGVFATDESCSPYSTNHAVVLVGWDDSSDAWILRNSWGPGWGEQGYMRINRHVSKVGTAANYVRLQPSVPQVYLPMVTR